MPHPSLGVKEHMLAGMRLLQPGGWVGAGYRYGRHNKATKETAEWKFQGGLDLPHWALPFPFCHDVRLQKHGLKAILKSETGPK